MKVIGIINPKGGVGKTTTTINLATALGNCGLRVGAFDLETYGSMSQGNYDLAGLSSYVERAKAYGRKLPFTLITGERTGETTKQAQDDIKAYGRAIKTKGFDIILVDHPAQTYITADTFTQLHKIIITSNVDDMSFSKASSLISTLRQFDRSQDAYFISSNVKSTDSDLALMKQNANYALNHGIQSLGFIPSYPASEMFRVGLCLADCSISKDGCSGVNAEMIENVRRAANKLVSFLGVEMKEASVIRDEMKHAS